MPSLELPAGHTSHAVPSLLANEPPAQRVQGLRPLEKKPELQLEQVVAPEEAL